MDDNLEFIPANENTLSAYINERGIKRVGRVTAKTRDNNFFKVLHAQGYTVIVGNDMFL